MIEINSTAQYYSRKYGMASGIVQYQIIKLSIVDYTPTHGTANLTLDSCLAYVETYRY